MPTAPDDDGRVQPGPDQATYPPHPDIYRRWGDAAMGSGAASASPSPAQAGGAAAGGWRCRWCATVNRSTDAICTTCHSPAPTPRVSDAQPHTPTGQIGTPDYPPFAPDGRVQPGLLGQPAGRPRGRGAQAGAALGLTATLIAVLSKAAVLAKFALPLLSALASLGIYAAIFGWQFGLGIVVLLFVHEIGHVLVIRAKGLPASLPIFIPLLGAAVLMRRMPQNAEDEAEIAIAGPLAGGLASLVCYLAYVQTGSHLWVALAYFSFFINLINLVPVSPLDGGRVAGAISRWIWPVGLVVVGVLFFYTHNILLILVAWLGLMQTIDAFRGSEKNERYYKVSLGARISLTLLYLALAALLAWGTLLTQHALIGGTSPFGFGQ